MHIKFLADHKHEADKIAHWYFEEFGPSGPVQSVDDTKAMVLTSANKGALPILFLGFEGNKLVGSAEVVKRSIENLAGYDYWLDGVYVDETHRGKGYSQALIKYAIQLAKEHGVPVLYLRCTESLVPFYKRHSFSVSTTHGDKYVMGLDL